MENQKKFLRILEFVIDENGFRILKSQNLNMPKSGIVKVNGQSGAGKSTFQEMCQIATTGAKAKRDGVPEPMDYRLKIGNENGKDFYIRVKTNTKNEITYTFLVEDVTGKLAKTDEPLGYKMTASQLHKLITTGLTFKINEMLSESDTIQTKWIIDTFGAELEKSGVIEIENKITEAKKYRDEAMHEKSKLGAFLDHIGKDFDRTEYFTLEDVSFLEEQKREKNKEIRAVESEINHFNLTASNTYNSIANELKAKMSEQWNKIEIYNSNIEKDYQIKLQEFNRLKQEHTYYTNLVIENVNTIRNSAKIIDEAINTDLLCKFEPYLQYAKTSEFTVAEPVKGNVLEKTNIFNCDISKYKEIAEHIEKLRMLNAEFQALKQPEVLSIEVKETPTHVLEMKLKSLYEEVDKLQISINEANARNEVNEKYNVWINWKINDMAVKELYAKKSKMFEAIETGVKGLKITQIEEESKNLTLTYDGSKDAKYFKNETNEARRITSYSKGQQHLIAAMLQLELMKKQSLALNVIFFDDLGIDNKLTELFDEFAKTNNLVIFVPQTNDKTLADIGNNEILITNGEIIFKDEI